MVVQRAEAAGGTAGGGGLLSLPLGQKVAAEKPLVLGLRRHQVGRLVDIVPYVNGREVGDGIVDSGALHRR